MKQKIETRNTDKVNNKGYLQNGNKLVMVQIGKEIFALHHYKTIDINKQYELETTLKIHDVRLLKDKEE